MKNSLSNGITLYYHQTDGGAEYLFDTFIECPNGHKEGVIKDCNIAIRLDGTPEILKFNRKEATK